MGSKIIGYRSELVDLRNWHLDSYVGMNLEFEIFDILEHFLIVAE